MATTIALGRWTLATNLHQSRVLVNGKYICGGGPDQMTVDTYGKKFPLTPRKMSC
jgi:hypothetical protein